MSELDYPPLPKNGIGVPQGDKLVVPDESFFFFVHHDNVCQWTQSITRIKSVSAHCKMRLPCVHGMLLRAQSELEG